MAEPTYESWTRWAETLEARGDLEKVQYAHEQAAKLYRRAHPVKLSFLDLFVLSRRRRLRDE